MSKSILVIATILLCIMVSCAQQNSPTGPATQGLRSDGTGGTQGQVSGTEVLSARLSLFVSFPNGQQVNVHQVTADWNPLDVTWNSFGAGHSANIEGSFTTVGGGRHNVDLTSLVQSWVDETNPVFGVLLDQASPGFSPQMVSSIESGSFGPLLEICYDSGGGLVCDTIVAQADVFIDEALPDSPREGSSTLFVAQMMTPGARKQALIRFALPDFVNSEPLPASIAGVVWDDANQDGVRDLDESGFPTIAVNLYDCLDNFLLATATDFGGAYSFADISTGTYVVEFVAPDGYVFSPSGGTVDDSLDSDADPSTGRTVCIDLVEGEVASFWSAGLYLPTEPDEPDDLVDPDDSGCTRGKGYWKNNAGFGTQMDELSALLPISLGREAGDKSLAVDDARTAVDVLVMKTYGCPSNGITKLYASLLVTKLNIAAGTDGEKVAVAIEEIDAFLANRSWVDWKALDRTAKQAIADWRATLNSYNDGEIGPGACE
jgi:hypothetical protein